MLSDGDMGDMGGVSLGNQVSRQSTPDQVAMQLLRTPSQAYISKEVAAARKPAAQ